MAELVTDHENSGKSIPVQSNLLHVMEFQSLKKHPIFVL